MQQVFRFRLSLSHSPPRRVVKVPEVRKIREGKGTPSVPWGLDTNFVTGGGGGGGRKSCAGKGLRQRLGLLGNRGEGGAKRRGFAGSAIGRTRRTKLARPSPRGGLLAKAQIYPTFYPYATHPTANHPSKSLLQY